MRIARRLLCIVLAAAALPAAAQNYPSRPVRLVVPYAPGQSADIVARVLAERLTRDTGASFVVENRPGAGGTLGVNYVARSPADGYTLVMATIGPLAQAPFLYPQLPYAPQRDLAPITNVALTPTVLVTGAQSGLSSVQDLVAKARAAPGTINFASAGPGSNQHVTMELFKARAGIDMTHIPFKGGAESSTALLAGTAAVMFDAIPAILTQVKSGKFKALAISAPRRSPLLPEVPTVAEAGVPGVDAVGWMGVAAPAKTPEAVLDYLNTHFRQALSDPEVVRRLDALAFTPDGMSRARFADFIRSENERWGKVIESAHIRLE